MKFLKSEWFYDNGGCITFLIKIVAFVLSLAFIGEMRFFLGYSLLGIAIVAAVIEEIFCDGYEDAL